MAPMNSSLTRILLVLTLWGLADGLRMMLLNDSSPKAGDSPDQLPKEGNVSRARRVRLAHPAFRMLVSVPQLHVRITRLMWRTHGL